MSFQYGGWTVLRGVRNSRISISLFVFAKVEGWAWVAVS